MAARGEGWIVNVSSASARYELGRPKELRKPPPFIGVYGASKAALNRMTAAFAAELLGSGVRVNTVEPRAAVMSEGAEALIGGTISEDLIESMEAMVEGALVLCDCPPDWTGGVHVSLDLLDTLEPHRDDARRQQAVPGRAAAGSGLNSRHHGEASVASSSSRVRSCSNRSSARSTTARRVSSPARRGSERTK